MATTLPVSPSQPSSEPQSSTAAPHSIVPAASHSIVPAAPQATVPVTPLAAVRHTPLTAPPTTLVNAQHTQPPKRFRFNTNLDVVLLRAVLTAGAHTAPWGKTQELFEKAYQLFVAAPLYTAENRGSARPSRKTLCDRYKKLVTERRVDNAKNAAASGITEEHGEKEQLLDDMIQQVDEWQEAEKAEKEEKSSKEKMLIEAGEEMRDRALKRQRRHTQRPARSTPRSTPTSSSEADPELELIAAEAESRNMAQKALQRLEEERLQLERSRLHVEQTREARLDDRESRRLALDERRTTLEEKRFEADAESRREQREERKLAIEERKSLIDVLGALANKLCSD